MTIDEARNKVIEEILKLYRSGYDGPMIGEEIAPLYRAIITLESLEMAKGETTNLHV